MSFFIFLIYPLIVFLFMIICVIFFPNKNDDTSEHIISSFYNDIHSTILDKNSDTYLISLGNRIKYIYTKTYSGLILLLIPFGFLFFVYDFYIGSFDRIKFYKKIDIDIIQASYNRKKLYKFLYFLIRGFCRLTNIPYYVILFYSIEIYSNIELRLE